MTDTMSPAQRHRCMSHIHSRNTKPELKVRQWLWKHGYRYRLCVKSVPGKPDIVMRKYRTAIFVNGCFWHGHGVELPPVETGHAVETRCSTSLQQVQSQPSAINSPCCKIPQTNRDFWVNKIRRNQERDQRNYQILQENGWQVRTCLDLFCCTDTENRINRRETMLTTRRTAHTQKIVRE